MVSATVNLNSKRAQEVKLNFLLAAVEGDGDLTSLLAYADWLEEQGKGLRAQHVRSRALHYAAEPGRTRDGETWLKWHVTWELGIVADGLAKSETAFRGFAHRGYSSRDDSSMELAMMGGYVPTLTRKYKRQAKLGRIIEALGYRVFWI